MRFAPDSHFSGNVSRPIDLTEHTPWLYLIACLEGRLIYVGETYDQGGLVARLSSHFGPRSSSTLRQAAARNAGVGVLRPPFIVVAARLPTNDPAVRFDGSSKKVRLLCEALVHTHAAKFASERRGWAVISTNSVEEMGENDEIVVSCESISTCFGSVVDFLKELTSSCPFHLVTLSQSREVLENADVGVLLNKIETMLYEWLLAGVQGKYGSDWWRKGVPKNCRVQCASKAEQEGKGLPPEAYLTFIDLRDIIRENWDLFGSEMEKVSNSRGKNRATNWLVDLNEMRKVWAHPIKQRFQPIPQASYDLLGTYFQKMRILL